MSRLLFSTVLGLSLAASGAAFAQSVGGSGSGMNANSGSMSGPNLYVDNGINTNGTPRQQSPGVSMTNGPDDKSVPATLNGDGSPQTGGAASTAIGQKAAGNGN
jgi:hypothetical protein